MNEKELQSEIWVTLSGLGVKLFRNQVGKYRLADGRFLSSGLIPGSGDLIGWRSVKITQDMVGKTVAQFVSVEVKTTSGKISEKQHHWCNAVNQAGGIACIARSPEEAVKFVVTT